MAQAEARQWARQRWEALGEKKGAQRGIRWWALAALVAALAYWGRLPAAHDPAQASWVLATSRDVAAGQKLLLGDLTAIPAAQAPHALGEHLLERVEGSTLLRDIRRSTPLYATDLDWGRGLRSRVPSGRLAYPLRAQSMPQLSEGDKVDVFWIQDNGTTEALLHGILVLDADRGQPIVALSEDEIAWVEMAGQTGKLRVAVQSSQGNPPQRKSRGRPTRARQRVKPPAIQILEGG